MEDRGCPWEIPAEHRGKFLVPVENPAENMDASGDSFPREIAEDGGIQQRKAVDIPAEPRQTAEDHACRVDSWGNRVCLCRFPRGTAEDRGCQWGSRDRGCPWGLARETGGYYEIQRKCVEILA